MTATPLHPTPEDPGTYRWRAVLAPLGVPTPHGPRALARRFTPTLRPRAPLTHEAMDGFPDVVGAVDEVTTVRGFLLAAGTVTEAAIAAAMAAGRLRPEVSMMDVDSDPDGSGRVLTSGTIVAVRAGTLPLWEVCRFTIDGSDPRPVRTRRPAGTPDGPQ